MEYQGALGFQYTEGENPIISIVFTFDDDITSKIIVVSTPRGWTLESQDGALTFKGSLNPGGVISIPISFHSYVKPGERQVTSTGTTSSGEVSQAVGPLMVLDMLLLRFLHLLNTNLTPLLALTALTGLTETYLTWRAKTQTTPPPPVNRGPGVVSPDIPTPNGTPRSHSINKGQGIITPEIPTLSDKKPDPGEFKPHLQEDPLKTPTTDKPDITPTEPDDKPDPGEYKPHPQKDLITPDKDKPLTPTDLDKLREGLEDGETGDPRPVRIEPGYALDSMGNDIVISEPVEIDLEELQNELRDPKYDTYLRYNETETDPVKPYRTHDPEPNKYTEPTRVRESPRFELRPAEDETLDPKLQEKVKEALEDLEKKKPVVEED